MAKERAFLIQEPTKEIEAGWMYARWIPGEEDIKLDGAFTKEELRTMADHMEKYMDMEPVGLTTHPENLSG